MRLVSWRRGDVIPQQIEASEHLNFVSSVLERYLDYDNVCVAALQKLDRTFVRASSVVFSEENADDIGAVLIDRILTCMNTHAGHASIQHYGFDAMCNMLSSIASGSVDNHYFEAIYPVLTSARGVQTIFFALETFPNHDDIQILVTNLCEHIYVHVAIYNSGLLLEFCVNLIQANLFSLAMSAIEEHGVQGIKNTRFPFLLSCVFRSFLRDNDVDRLRLQTVREHVRNDPNINSVIERLRVMKEQMDARDLAYSSQEVSRSFISAVLAHLVTAADG